MIAALDRPTWQEAQKRLIAQPDPARTAEQKPPNSAARNAGSSRTNNNDSNRTRTSLGTHNARTNSRQR